MEKLSEHEVNNTFFYSQCMKHISDNLNIIKVSNKMKCCSVVVINDLVI